MTKGPNILLVDDEEGIRRVLGISLEDAGYQVATAASGEEALEIFHRKQPTIVLTDIKMPGMGGVELLKMIKQAQPDTEVIMITGHGDMDLAIECLKLEAIDFITKPINDDALEIALKRANDKIAMRNQIQAYTQNLEQMVREKSARLVEAERLAAVGQAVEGFTTALKNIAGDLDSSIKYFNDMPCLVSVHNEAMKVIATNQLYRERLGERTGQNSWDIYSGALGRRTTSPIGRTFATGEGQRLQGILKYQEGGDAPVIVYTAPIRDSGGKVVLAVEIAADVGELKRLQEDLRTSQMRYRQLFDEVPCYISVQDRTFGIIDANRRFKEDFGEAIGSRCYQTYRRRSQPCDDCPVARTFDDGGSHQVEKVVTALDGENYNVLVQTAPIHDSSGEINQVMEMSTNITQIRQLQDHLTSLGLLIGTVSHSVKGLLTGLDGGMYLLHSGFTKENKALLQEGWSTVRSTVDHIRRLITNILYYAKDRELELEGVDPAQLVQELITLMTPKVENRSIHLQTDIPTDLGSFDLDAGILHTALVNLLENAIEACIQDTAKANHRVGVKVRLQADELIFEVSDDAAGMDQRTLDQLFTRFFSTKGKKGTGLGLYISKKVIQQHGGRLTVDSQPGAGTTFSICIPLRFSGAAGNPF